MTRHFILSTAGHVDHGKSGLVRALTGTDPDRLPEEKSRGITIDLGFARLLLPAYSKSNDTLEIGVVDVPGHEDFVHNMVAGVGSVDVALLVVAADDGWMPQTEEHVHILTYLGVTRAVVALTKADRVDDVEHRVEAVRVRLGRTVFAGAAIVPTSIVTGNGLPELRECLARELTHAPDRRDIGKPVLWIDRAFTLRGIGAVVTGTLRGGTLRCGDTVALQPAGFTARVRTIQNHNRESPVAEPGTRTALSLSDVTVATDAPLGSRTVRRGYAITRANAGAASPTLDVWLQRWGSGQTVASGASALKHGGRVRVHLGTSKLTARVALADRSELVPGEEAIAQLRFADPVWAMRGDRLIVRDWSERATLAGGVVLDPNSRRKFFRSKRQQAFLLATLNALEDAKSAVLALMHRDGQFDADALWPQANFSDEELREAFDALVAEELVVRVGARGVFRERWERLRSRALALVTEHHQLHPAQPGMPLVQLRDALKTFLPSTDSFDGLVSDLATSECSRCGSALKLQSHRPRLPPHLQAAGLELQRTLASKPLDPPSKKELAPDRLRQEALRFLVATGQGIEIGGEVVLLAEYYHSARETVCRFLRIRSSATVSELRQVLDSTRRIVVPLLEKLDQEGVTFRQGDKRMLRENVTRNEKTVTAPCR